ncbi:asparaginase [Alkalilimnicola sp. S0819]|nr:asparaginase [Alkalilimnicola sp. S0819]KAB7622765.1 asparaginase [Alkalilimnicola sp. S0819]MPQ17260.1 asparaginase [Alkalilimnicola sp. S0819]
MPQPKPDIALFALGGTIAMTTGDAPGVVPSLSGESLVQAVPALAEHARLRVRSFRQLPGSHLSYADLEALVVAIERAVAEGARGVVVTQGTDSIEESAFILDRLLALDAPVVVTGAMRNPVQSGADGPANLLAAVQVAASEQARGMGCLVVFNERIHAARFVRKAHTSNPGAFDTPLAGPLGWVAEGRVRIVLRPESVPPLPPCDEIREAPVALLTMSLGDGPELVRALAGQGFAGLVMAGAGAGHVSPPLAEALGELASRMPVVLASRIAYGEVLRDTYGYPGSEIDLLKRGLLHAGWLDPLKAKALLALCLRYGLRNADQLHARFAPWGGGYLG